MARFIANKLYVNNSNVIELRELTSASTGLIDTGATVSVTLFDTDDVEVTGETWPLNMPHVAGGTYKGVLVDTLDLQYGTKYVASVQAVGTNSEVGRWEVSLVAQRRKGC